MIHTLIAKTLITHKLQPIPFNAARVSKLIETGCYEQAALECEQRANEGDADAMCLLGIAKKSRCDLQVNANYADALLWLDRAYQANRHPKAAYALGMHYLLKKNDGAKALPYLEPLSDLNPANVGVDDFIFLYFCIGNIYKLHDVDVPNKEEKVREYYMRVKNCSTKVGLRS